MLEKYRQGDSRVYRKSRKRAAEGQSFGYVQLGQHHAARAVGYEPHKPGNKRLKISRARKHVVQPLLSRIEQKQSEKHVDNQNKSKYFQRMHHRMKDVILPEIVPFFYVMIYSEDDYLNTARRSPDEYMESASDEIKAQIAEFEQLEATEAEKAMQKWDMEIQDSKNVNCQALRGNMAFSEISIDKETLVDRNNINAQLEQRFPNFFFCTVPGTKGEQTLMLPKNQVFTVNDADKARYVAFVNNQKPVKLWVKGEPDGGTTYKTGKELFEKFDKHDNNAELTRNISKALEAAPVPKAAPVK